VKGCIVNVATGRFVTGQKRLTAAVGTGATMFTFANHLPPGSPTHEEVPYAFKAFALQDAVARGHSLLLWADACILPIQSVGPLFDRIYEQGYWISNNGWINSEWTAESAYRDLGVSREENATIPHLSATTFGLNIYHPLGCRLLNEYIRLAKTRAFCGPWRNTPETPCGTVDALGRPVLGHRHDQSSLSLIAWRLGLKPTNPPDVFSYKGGETSDTILLADGDYA
jgi:hypothetical protein